MTRVLLFWRGWEVGGRCQCQESASGRTRGIDGGHVTRPRVVGRCAGRAASLNMAMARQQQGRSDAFGGCQSRFDEADAPIQTIATGPGRPSSPEFGAGGGRAGLHSPHPKQPSTGPTPPEQEQERTSQAAAKRHSAAAAAKAHDATPSAAMHLLCFQSTLAGGPARHVLRQRLLKQGPLAGA